MWKEERKPPSPPFTHRPTRPRIPHVCRVKGERVSGHIRLGPGMNLGVLAGGQQKGDVPLRLPHHLDLVAAAGDRGLG